MSKEQLPFGKNNYIFMLAGIALIVLGFGVMYMEDAPMGFGPLGLTVGPLIIMAGFGIQFYAILQKPKS